MSQDTPDVWQRWGDRLTPIDFEAAHKAGTLEVDIVGRVISGEVRDMIFRKNFQRCAFKSTQAHDNDWTNVDYKDCSFSESIFEDCQLGGGSTVSCTFSACTFVRTSFRDAAFHDCVYIDCVFNECDFGDSMIRNSHIIECRYQICATTNKLFDGCLIVDCAFDKTMLDARAITDNFGIDRRQIDQSLVRVDRSYPNARIFDFDAVVDNHAALGYTNAFDLLKISFYLSGGEMPENSLANDIFKADSWTALVRAPVNFARLLQDMSDFLFTLYDRDRLPVLYILKLSTLSDNVWNLFHDLPGAAHLGQTAAGVHLQCLQRLENLEDALKQVDGPRDGTKLVYRSQDDAADNDVAALAEELQHWLNGAVFEIRPRNSPVEIVYFITDHPTILVGLYIFLTTRTRIQLAHAPKLASQASGEPAGATLELGSGRSKDLQNILRFGGTMPGILTFKINIDVDFTLMKKIKTLIKSVCTEQ